MQCRQEYLGVRAGRKPESRSRELGAQFEVVVELAIEDQAAFSAALHRLQACFAQVDDREALVPDHERVGAPHMALQAAAIRTSMCLDPMCCLQHLGIEAECAGLENPENPAHQPVTRPSQISSNFRDQSS